ncbi:hypothetical protein L484_014775 [Morus notabilis]|uniref:Uncharacterized protein n=1 Tax=Morus notabilis TaxID=981085 RepID=W9SA69_9ROSA|nr:hypothetical protein L484_014775 [Morus notabilis]
MGAPVPMRCWGFSPYGVVRHFPLSVAVGGICCSTLFECFFDLFVASQHPHSFLVVVGLSLEIQQV